MRHRRKRMRVRSPSIAAEVTASVLEAIKAGCTPWEMPWHRRQGSAEWPRSLTGRRYSGINVLALWASARRFGFSDPTWATEERWRAVGMRPLPGENTTAAIVYREREIGPAPNNSRIRFARRLPLFNRNQVFGASIDNPRRPVAMLVCVDEFARSTGAAIQIGGDGACYRPDFDDILVPHRSRFRGALDRAGTAYANVMLHELVHWTGAPHRLNRDLSGRFGDAAYAMEELVAELGCAFLCAELGFASRPCPDHARYISGWLSVLNRDHRAILLAASHAERATRFLLKFRRQAFKTLKTRPLKEPKTTV
jgi:antirestriction protein ArdC